MVETRSGRRVTRQRAATPRRRAPTCAEAGAKLRSCPRPGVRARRAAGGAAGATSPSGSTTPPGIFGAGRPHIGKHINKVKKSMEVGGSGPGAGGDQTPPAPIGGKADHDMVTVPLLNLSENQKQRLRNEKAVRVTMGTGCDKCSSCVMSQENAKKIMKKKGSAATISLGKGEIDKNKISGSGIMPRKTGGPIHGAYQPPKGGAVGGLVVGPDKDGCYTSYTDNFKENRMDKKKSCPTKPKGTKKPWKEPGWSPISAKTAGKGSNAVRDPAKRVPKGGKTLGSRWGKPSGSNFKRNTGGWGVEGEGISPTRAEKEMKKIYDKMDDEDKDRLTLEEFVDTIASEAQQMPSFSTTNMSKVAKEIEADYEIPQGAARMALHVMSMLKEGQEAQDAMKGTIKKATKGKGMYASGDGIYARGNGSHGGAIGNRMGYSETSSIGAGGNLLGPMAASKAPQAAAQNWFFASQFQPSMAADIRGNGLKGFIRPGF